VDIRAIEPTAVQEGVRNPRAASDAFRRMRAGCRAARPSRAVAYVSLPRMFEGLQIQLGAGRCAKPTRRPILTRPLPLLCLSAPFSARFYPMISRNIEDFVAPRGVPWKKRGSFPCHGRPRCRPEPPIVYVLAGKARLPNPAAPVEFRHATHGSAGCGRRSGSSWSAAFRMARPTHDELASLGGSMTGRRSHDAARRRTRNWGSA